MLNRKRISLPLIILILLGLGTFWLDRVTRPPEQTRDDNLYLYPDYIVENLSGIRVDHEQSIQRTFTAGKLLHYLKKELTQLEQIGFVNIDPGHPLMRLQADRARVEDKGKNVYLMENVVAIRGSDHEKGKITLTSDFLHLIPDENLVKTDQGVLISRMNTTINATGLELDSRIGMLQLLSAVKAVNQPSLKKP